MISECWICRQISNKTNLCNCDNDYSYCHSYCLDKWIESSSNIKCKFCNSNYKLSYYYYINKYIFKIIKNIFDGYIFLLDYDLEKGIRWEELYD
jgi:hypothetical protein